MLTSAFFPIFSCFFSYFPLYSLQYLVTNKVCESNFYYESSLAYMASFQKCLVSIISLNCVFYRPEVKKIENVKNISNRKFLVQKKSFISDKNGNIVFKPGRNHGYICTLKFSIYFIAINIRKNADISIFPHFFLFFSYFPLYSLQYLVTNKVCESNFYYENSLAYMASLLKCLVSIVSLNCVFYRPD